VRQEGAAVTRVASAGVGVADEPRRERAPATHAGKLRLGIDFDNTLIAYDHVFRAQARARKLLSGGFRGSKQAVRDAVRRLPDGEITWQRLQGYVYGQGIGEAALFAGVDRFLRRCRQAGHTVFIVSHKTEYANYDPARVNLRTAALGFMEAHGFFEPSRYGIPREHVFFEGTRADKLARIAALGCTHFIDDLVEVLTDPGFPAGVERVLFGPADGAHTAGLRVYPTWREIAAALLAEPQQ
jgi:hypothetical protein